MACTSERPAAGVGLPGLTGLDSEPLALAELAGVLTFQADAGAIPGAVRQDVLDVNSALGRADFARPFGVCQPGPGHLLDRADHRPLDVEDALPEAAAVLRGQRAEAHAVYPRVNRHAAERA